MLSPSITKEINTLMLKVLYSFTLICYLFSPLQILIYTSDQLLFQIKHAVTFYFL